MILAVLARTLSAWPAALRGKPAVNDPVPQPRAVGAADFDTAVIERSRMLPVVVDFWAAWCAPCRMLAPLLERLAPEYAGRAEIAKVDTDAEPTLAARFGIRSLPTLAVFRDGRLADAVLGVQPEAVLRELIERHIERPGDRERQAAVAAAAAGDVDGGIATLERLVATEPDRPQHFLALLDALVGAGRLEAAQATIDGAALRYAGDREFEQRRAGLEIARAALAGEVPDPVAARHGAAARRVLEGQHRAALEDWLELMRAHPKFGGGRLLP